MKTDNRELFENMPVSRAVVMLIVPTVISQIITVTGRYSGSVYSILEKIKRNDGEYIVNPLPNARVRYKDARNRKQEIDRRHHRGDSIKCCCPLF